MRDFHDHPVDKAFAEKLKDAKVKAPARVWESVSAQMETQRLRRKVAYAQWTAAAAVALLVCFSSWYFIWGSAAAGSSATNTTEAFASVKPPKPTQAGAQLASLAKEIACPEITPRTQTTPQLVERIRFRTLLGQPIDIVPKRVILTGFNPQQSTLREPFLESDIAWHQPSILEVPQEQSPQLEVNKEFISEFVPHEEPRNGRKGGKFSIGGAIGPDVAFASQTPVSLGRVNYASSEVLPTNPEDASRRFTPVTAVTTGLNAGYDLAPRLKLNSGLYYTNRQSDSEHGIYTSKGKVEAVTTKFEVAFLEIPATVQYEWLQRKKWSSYVSSGVSASMFLYYDNTFESSSGINARNVSDKSEAMNLAQTSLLVSAGVDLDLSDHVSLNLEPRLRYGVLTNSYAFSQSNPLSLAGISGINFRF